MALDTSSAADYSDLHAGQAPGFGAGLAAADAQTSCDAMPRYLEALKSRGVQSGQLLRVSGAGPRADTEAFLCHARASGFQVRLLDLSGTAGPQQPAACDAAVMLYQLQAHPAPGDLLEQVHRALRPGAPLLLTVPCANSWTVSESRPENLWYFEETSLQLLLLRHGFCDVMVRRLRRPISGMLAVAARAEKPARPKYTVIIAAFNESKTFPILMEALLKKEIPGVDRQIIIVESNSTDGTRELAKRYENHPEVQLVLQDRPLGKGNAIREGFRHATGDIVLIQDADLEYDLNDYDSLLAPILAHRALFVLGTRHAGDWKMRKFTAQKIAATALNSGHVFFTGLMNTLFRQNMTDPFTMFKVFHRDCLYGLHFQCNRFDFDHELVIKLIRKGYVPLEIPVNYASRSFREGKKIRVFRDPISWLWVNLKLRVTRR